MFLNADRPTAMTGTRPRRVWAAVVCLLLVQAVSAAHHAGHGVEPALGDCAACAQLDHTPAAPSRDSHAGVAGAAATAAWSAAVLPPVSRRASAYRPRGPPSIQI